MSALEPRGSIYQSNSASLADILERVLDKGIVIAGDVQVNLLDIHHLTLKRSLLSGPADTARSMGIDWWEPDPALSSLARDNQLEQENRELRERLGKAQARRHKEVEAASS